MRQCRHMMYIVEDGIKADQLNKRKGDGHQIKAGRKWLEFKPCKELMQQLTCVVG